MEIQYEELQLKTSKLAHFPQMINASNQRIGEQGLNIRHETFASDQKKILNENS